MSDIMPILGDTSVPLRLTVNEIDTGGVNGLTSIVAVRRVVDGFYLDFNDNTFKSSAWTTRQQTMTQPSTSNSPGVYQLIWNSSLSVSALGDYVAEYQITTVGSEQVASDNVAFVSDIKAVVDAILVDTNEMQGKLPTNNIMGSSVKDDQDTVIKLIKQFFVNKLELSDGDVENWVIFDDDDVTPLLKSNVTDKNGGAITSQLTVPANHSRFQ